MKIAVSGASGLVGSALLPLLRADGHTTARMVRRAASGDDIPWDVSTGVARPELLDGVDGVVHLAGENISGGRWTAARKERIRASRAEGTRQVAEAMASRPTPPKVLVAASAIGYYGDRGDEVLREDSPPGDSFLSEVCRQWEAATQPASAAGIRVVNLRFGVILSTAGGALARMLLPFRLGAGGRIGDGRQYMSWISLEDATAAVLHALNHPDLAGPVNTVAPSPVRNAEFTSELGRALSRPTIFPMPAFAARLAFGEMADELLLASTCVEPARLRESGYAFRHPDLAGALHALLVEG